jgi:hypothetical protein
MCFDPGDCQLDLKAATKRIERSGRRKTICSSIIAVSLFCSDFAQKSVFQEVLTAGGDLKGQIVKKGALSTTATSRPWTAFQYPEQLGGFHQETHD